MKKGILGLVSVVAILAATMFLPAACQTTGNVKNDLTSLWNSPTVQTELSAIEQAAINFAQKFITSHLGGTTGLKVTSSTTQNAITNAVNSIQHDHPDVPRRVILDTVKAKFAERL